MPTAKPENDASPAREPAGPTDAESTPFDRRTPNREHPGARWWKLDVHTHTPASLDTHWSQQNLDYSPRDWLKVWMDAEVDCVAITDHNTGAWIDKLKAEYAAMQAEDVAGFRKLYLFPGVELSVQGGVHILAVFDPSEGGDAVTKLLGAVQYPGTLGDSDGVTDLSAVAVVEAIHKAGALAIPAHVDGQKGLLACQPIATIANDAPLAMGLKSLFDPGSLRSVLRSEYVLACEVVQLGAQLPALYYDEKVQWAKLAATDWHGKPRDAKPGSRFTWVKMAEPSLEGLRLALLDGERFSVVAHYSASEANPPDACPTHYVEELSVAHARFLGNGAAAVARLSPWFNGIVGGRGSGKSTFVHALRMAYGREGELPDGPGASEAARAFHAFRKVGKREESGGLTQKTEVTATVCRADERYRLTFRVEGPARPIVERWDGSSFVSDTNQSSSHERFPIRILSQGQLVELAEPSRSDGEVSPLLEMIDRASGATSAKAALRDARNGYLSVCARIREMDSRLSRRPDLEVRLTDVKRALETYEKDAKDQTLRRYQIAVRQEREVARQLESARRLADDLMSFSDKLVAEDPALHTFAGEGEATSAARRAVEQVAANLKEARGATQLAARALRDKLALVETEVASGVWRTTVDEAKASYSALAQIRQGGGAPEPSAYGGFVQQKQSLEKELGELTKLSADREALQIEVDKAKERVREARSELSEVRQRFLEEKLSGNKHVSLRLVQYGQTLEGIERSLRVEVNAVGDKFASDISYPDSSGAPGGLVPDLLRDLPADSFERSLVLETRLDDLRNKLIAVARGSDGVGAHLKRHLRAELQARPDLVDRLSVFFPEDDIEVRYDPDGQGRKFQTIRQASAGQKAAAMLSFLLAHGEEPLVLDQPEDDLDNRLIYELVVKQIRENKVRRQLIVVTHNPNIVVNGDAEMVHVMEWGSGQCFVKAAGALQSDKVRDEVCKVMEGGREAFRSRYLRLGRER